MSDYRDSIDTVMDNFDFGRVHTVMVATNWLWHRRGGSMDDYYRPEVSDLRKRAREQLRETVDEMQSRKLKEFAINCGGFRTHAWQEDENAKVYVQLEFVVESWDNFEG
jgi:hypothetical protein